MSKFRAWNPQLKIMSYDFCEINVSGSNIVASVEEGCLEVKYLKEPLMHYREAPTMEPTGLHDKLKNNVWQGDIIKIPVEINTEFHGDFTLHEVIKINGQWVTSYLRSEKGAKLPKGYLRGFLLKNYEFDTTTFLYNIDYEPTTEIEVVGNIYENPELTHGT
ncbi:MULTISPECIES: YopX family protein [Paenibacillus]|uniref:YopX family protein n=1 Tax=Paenibacillus TaxID=44249 RepID=UPI00096F7873|nr:YopX family protein [Paenibacillus odorifer]OME06748.1 hypothetical protein BSK60_32200 [Paenibacillus odorifer]